MTGDAVAYVLAILVVIAAVFGCFAVLLTLGDFSGRGLVLIWAGTTVFLAPALL